MVRTVKSSLSLIALAVGLLISIPGNCAVMDIVKAGKACAVIVIPDNPLPVVSYAAQELQYHIGQSTGATLGIISESQKPSDGSFIYIGDCQPTREAGLQSDDFLPNGCVVKTIGNNLFMVGNDSDGPVLGRLINNYTRVGTLFAVYEFLENEMNVHWLWPGKLGEVIPQHSKISVTKLNITWKPSFIRSRFRDAENDYETKHGWASPEARVKFLDDQSVWLRRQRFAMAVDVNIGHAFSNYWERFSTTHPEFFSMLPDGTRRPDPSLNNRPDLVAMCVSQPGLWKQIIEDWKTNRTPLRPQINLCENDTCGKCICPTCLSWDALDPNSDLPAGVSHLDFANRVELTKKAWLPVDRAAREAAINLGSLSDRYAKFYMAVQNEAGKIDPNVVVCAYAYANYSRAPIKTQLNERVYIGIVPQLLYPWTDKKRADFRAQWDGWAKAGARLFLRPNYPIDGHNMPIYYARKFGEDFGYAAKRGMIATDFDSINGQWAAQGPNLYVIGRMNVHPDWPVDKALNEYYAAFGPAESAVRAYFRHWERVSDSVTDEAYTKFDGGWDHFYMMASRIFTPSVMSEGNALLSKASAAAKGNVVAEQRVAFLEKGFHNAELTLAAQSGYDKYKKSGNIQDFVVPFRALVEFRKSMEGDNIANMGLLSWLEDGKWDRNLL